MIGGRFEDLLPELPGGDAAFPLEEVGEIVFVIEIQFPGDLLDREAGFAQQQGGLKLELMGDVFLQGDSGVAGEGARQGAAVHSGHVGQFVDGDSGVDVPFDVIEHLPVAGEDGVLEGHQIAGEKIRGDLKEHSLDLAGALNAVEREAADAVELLNDFRSHFPLHVREAEEDFGEGKQLQIVMKRIEAGTGPEMERDRHSGAEEEEISRLHRQFAAEHRRADGGPRSFRGKNRKDPVERIGVDRAAVEIRSRIFVQLHRKQIGVVGLLGKKKRVIHKIASF